MRVGARSQPSSRHPRARIRPVLLATGANDPLVIVQLWFAPELCCRADGGEAGPRLHSVGCACARVLRRNTSFSAMNVTRTVRLMTLPGTTASLQRFCRGAGLEGDLWAWIKSASPLVASSRSGLHKTSVKAGDDGRVFQIFGKPFWFYAAWSAEQWGIFALCVLYTYAWARGVWTHWLWLILSDQGASRPGSGALAETRRSRTPSRPALAAAVSAE